MGAIKNFLKHIVPATINRNNKLAEKVSSEISSLKNENSVLQEKVSFLENELKKIEEDYKRIDVKLSDTLRMCLQNRGN